MRKIEYLKTMVRVVRESNQFDDKDCIALEFTGTSPPNWVLSAVRDGWAEEQVSNETTKYVLTSEGKLALGEGRPPGRPPLGAEVRAEREAQAKRARAERDASAIRGWIARYDHEDELRAALGWEESNDSLHARQWRKLLDIVDTHEGASLIAEVEALVSK